MKRRPQAERGFTLIEMMVVVIIVGVLATLAVYGIRKYIYSAKTSEAVSMITVIKAAQESYKDETFTYLDVSGGDYSALYPMATPGKKKVMWGGGTDAVAQRWRALGVTSDAPVQFAYASVAVNADNALPEPPTSKSFGFVAGEPAYAVLAKGDVNGDGNFQYVVGHSFNAEIYIENEGE